MARIAIISTMGGTSWGGSEYLWAATAEEAIAQGHEVFLSVNDHLLQAPRVLQVQELGVVLIPRNTSMTKKISRLRKIFKKIPHTIVPSPYQGIFDAKPDVICISQGGSYDIGSLPELYSLLNTHTIPYTLICHANLELSPAPPSHRLGVAQLYQNATQVCFVAEGNRRIAERYLAFAPTNATIVKNPVNLTDTSPIAFPNIDDVVSFASVARLETPAKGQDVLLEALSTEKWKARNWRCSFYGEGPHQEYLEALVKHYQLEDRVFLKGHVKDIRQVWAENHLFVMPSRLEGTPLSLVEAMLCGRPALVTDVGDNAVWITEKKTGFIAPAPTANSLAETLERAWEYRSQWETMGMAAHHYAKENIDPEPGKTMLDRLLSR
jgi:L-malate glycosyltransferase